MLGCQSPKFRDKVETNTHNKVLTTEQVLHHFLCKGISKEHLEDKETSPSILLPLWIELSHFGNMSRVLFVNSHSASLISLVFQGTGQK